MNQLDEDFIKLVDTFVVEAKDPKLLEDISSLDRESRILGITFYDMLCVILQDATKHKVLVSEFKTYMKLKKPAAFAV